MTPEDLAYLHHILDAIRSIEEFSEGIGSEAPSRRLERAGIERMLTIIDEAVKMIRRSYVKVPGDPGGRQRGCEIRSSTITSV